MSNLSNNQKFMPNQKGFSRIAIIIIVLILIGGAYFVFSKKDENVIVQNAKNQNSQSGNSSTDQLSTDNWKTYNKYGFEFKHPSEWITSKDDSIIKYHWYLTDDLLFFSPNRKSPKDSLVMAFSLSDNSKNNYTIDSLAACSNPEDSEARFIGECKDVLINGVSYKKFISKVSASEVGGLPIALDQKYVTVVTVYDNKSLVVSAKINDERLLNENVILSKFDSILPTFKFTKQLEQPVSKLKKNND